MQTLKQSGPTSKISERHWLALLQTTGFHAQQLKALRQYDPDLSLTFSPQAKQNLYQSLRQAADAFPITPHSFTKLSQPNWAAIDDDLAWLQQPNHHLITYDDPRYPDLLKEIPDAPCALFIQGNPNLLASPQFAIVGSRNPSHIGRQSAHDFAKELASLGLTITSGLALGIDASSHQGALAAQANTIAVLGCGLAHIYPARHRQLAEDIVQNGAIISEFPSQTKPYAHNFPLRNRIISGLSLGVLVVEAALRSGSLITARYATEQGREVFALPGSIHNPLARGCHKLIREGAKLVETTTDICEELTAMLKFIGQCASTRQEIVENPPQLEDDYATLINSIGFEATSTDVIIQRSGLPADAVASMLLALELRGLVQLGPGGYHRQGDLLGVSP